MDMLSVGMPKDEEPKEKRAREEHKEKEVQTVHNHLVEDALLTHLEGVVTSMVQNDVLLGKLDDNLANLDKGIKALSENDRQAGSRHSGWKTSRSPRWSLPSGW